MSVLDLIEELVKQGHEVHFYKRKDGGYRITSIDRKRFTGSSGNVEARKILGVKLSERRERSLKKLTTPKGKGSYNRRRKEPLDEETKKAIRRLQRMYLKSGKKEGMPTIRNYRYILKTKGKEEADRLLHQSERRILGLAYIENVNALLQRLLLDLNKKDDPDMSSTWDLIYSKRFEFKEVWIPEIYEILYKWEQGQIEGNEAARLIRAIIQ